MNPARQTAILLLTMLASFAVTFGVGVMWQGAPAEPPPIVHERAAIQPRIAPSPIRSVPPAVQLSPAVPDTAILDAKPPPASGSSTPVEAAALPIQIRFRHINNIIQATVVNVSDAELTVDATVLNSDTRQTSQTTLNLTPRIPAVFGIRDGLELHPADEVTLRGGSYRELVATVR
jgi:hypothetical protein